LRLGVKSYQRHKSHLYRKDAKTQSIFNFSLRLRALALKIFLTQRRRGFCLSLRFCSEGITAEGLAERPKRDFSPEYCLSVNDESEKVFSICCGANFQFAQTNWKFVL
jgi:hypothetical protein